MKVAQVAIRPTEASDLAGRPALTPELLAASGARYSRNNDGLDAILSKIDPNNLDKSVDSIFKMIDYGHQSIADMVPVAIFIDDVSILLAYLIWSWCPTAGGQESSTRYIKLDRDGLVDPELLSVKSEKHSDWYKTMDRCFDCYGSALSFWERIAIDRPDLTKIPDSLLEDSSEKARKQVARMLRNYAFDRARYFLPVAAKTNLMLVMSARGWSQLCQNLLSYYLPEAHMLGSLIRDELALSAPRLVKHATAKSSSQNGHLLEFREVRLQGEMILAGGHFSGEARDIARVQMDPPNDIDDAELAHALAFHDNRYAWIGSACRRTSLRFSWTAVSIAEIRDLNRHRTGSKFCPLAPVGFYCATDQTPQGVASLDSSLTDFADTCTHTALEHLSAGDMSYMSWTLLGHQYSFEHTTTLDKYVYEAELRTGTGAHFRYAKHLRDSVTQLALISPGLASQIQVGESEPE